MADSRIYIDSSVWNAVFDEHVPEIRAFTLRFFERIEADPSVRPYLSDVVLQELGNAPPERFPLLGRFIERITPVRFELDDASVELADAYVRHGILTAGHLTDARHVAIATVAGLDVLTSWNYRHLVNRRRREAFNGVNSILGYRSLEIISPPEVFDD